MVGTKCPGWGLGWKKPEDVVEYKECPNCGYDIEFFLDDKSRKCPECSTVVIKNDEQFLKDYGCADWCYAAEDCLGTKLYSRIKEAKKRIKEGHLENLVHNLPEKENMK